MMEEILKEIQKLVPEVLGVIVASDEGLPNNNCGFGFRRKRYDGKRTKGV